MDIREIIEKPEIAIAQRFGTSPSPELCNEIYQHVENIGACKKSIKALKKEKQSVSRQFKDAANDSERLSQLKSEMQAISQKVNQTESSRKESESWLKNLFEESEPAKPEFPARFNQTANEPSHASIDHIQIRLLEDSEAESWNAYCEKNPRTTAYHDYRWKAVIGNSFGHTLLMFGAFDNNQLVGVFPVCHMQSAIFGNFHVSVPYFNYGGPLADTDAIEALLVKQAWQSTRDTESSHLEYRTCTAKFSEPSLGKKASMILALPSTQADLDSSLGAKVRAQFKQADQYSPSVAFGKEELLDDFYYVFCRNMRDLGTPVYSKSFFKHILQAFPEQATLVVVKVNNKPAACAFLFAYKDMLEIPWASTLKRYNSMNINMWMYRQILGFAIDSAFSYFDFGRSTKDAGTYKFKKQWGAKPVEHHWYYCLPEGEQLPELNPDNPKFKLAITVWKRLPIFVSNTIGPFLVKNIP